MAGRGWPLAWQVKEELEKRSACVLTGGEVMLAGTVRGKRQYHKSLRCVCSARYTIMINSRSTTTYHSHTLDHSHACTQHLIIYPHTHIYTHTQTHTAPHTLTHPHTPLTSIVVEVELVPLSSFARHVYTPASSSPTDTIRSTADAMDSLLLNSRLIRLPCETRGVSPSLNHNTSKGICPTTVQLSST